MDIKNQEKQVTVLLELATPFITNILKVILPFGAHRKIHSDSMYCQLSNVGLCLGYFRSQKSKKKAEVTISKAKMNIEYLDSGLYKDRTMSYENQRDVKSC